MEALSVFEAERKRHRRRLDSLNEHLGEIRRNVSISSLVPSPADHLTQVLIDTDLLFKDFTYLLFQTLEILGNDAELIHPTPEILLKSRANTLIGDPTDNLILACILDHSKNHPSESKIFLSENRKDFGTNDRAKLALRQAGVRYFADASKCLEWHKAQSET